MNNPSRCEIWLVSFEPQIGSEIKKTRPAVVLTIDSYQNTPFRVVVPIRDYKEFHSKLSHMIVLEKSAYNGLSKKSTVDCLQVKSFDLNRFIHKIGKIKKEEMLEISTAVGISLGCI